MDIYSWLLLIPLILIITLVFVKKTTNKNIPYDLLAYIVLSSMGIGWFIIGFWNEGLSFLGPIRAIVLFGLIPYILYSAISDYKKDKKTS
ncbi:putative neutral ceramidase superfamily lipid hydrolase [Alkalibacillus flavidus]|uniref:Neutral ceramidase superfamily lipid hydrolase n=1 Tax=Alkalibacillus flavidus TaxID=546021 RepID=A0ABV2KV59_9BACI